VTVEALEEGVGADAAEVELPKKTVRELGVEGNIRQESLNQKPGQNILIRAKDE
jgi:hypothetical protein